MSGLPRSADYFVDKLSAMARAVRDTVVKARAGNAAFAGVSRNTAADTIYELDTHVEPVLEAFCEKWSEELPLVLIAEGAEGGGGPDGKEGEVAFPRGSDPAKAAVRLIVDPIDGTRGLMYDKRAAWVLAGVAPNKGEKTKLSDIAVALQAEVPTSKQTLADVLWASKGAGAHATRDDLISKSTKSLALSASKATTLAHGFATVSNFFPGTKRLSSDLMERIAEKTMGSADVTKAAVFDDQYISTGGQFYELMVGHDRFNADLRPLFYAIQKQPPGLCVHPYDVASALIAREAGVILTDGLGNSLDGPLDVETPLAWIGYANESIHQLISPIVKAFFQEHGMHARA